MNKMRGFVEVEIGEKKRPVKYSYNALCLFGDLAKLSLVELQGLTVEGLSASQFRQLFFAGLWEGCRVMKVPLDFTEFDVGDWLEDLGANQRKEIMDVFLSAMNSVIDDGKKDGKGPDPN
jgi:hypothetical protein